MLRIVSTCLLLISGHALAQDADGDGFDVSADCDDSNPSVFPGAIELPADGVDQSCDGFELCFVDADLDGFGDATGTVVSTANLACDGAGQAATDTDCNDADPTIYPGALEIPADGIDQDCDSADLFGCYEDADLDGYGSTNVIGAPGDPSCAQPGNSLLQSDCDDSNPAVYPGAPEICGDGIDNDCDGIGAGVDDEDNDGLTYAEEALLGTSDCDSDSDGDGSDDRDDKRQRRRP